MLYERVPACYNYMAVVAPFLPVEAVLHLILSNLISSFVRDLVLYFYYPMVTSSKTTFLQSVQLN